MPSLRLVPVSLAALALAVPACFAEVQEGLPRPQSTTRTPRSRSAGSSPGPARVDAPRGRSTRVSKSTPNDFPLTRTENQA